MKVYKPLSKAIYSIQFWRDSNKIINVTETCQSGSLDSLDMRYLGRKLKTTKLLDKKDIKGLEQFCLGFLEDNKEV